MVEEMLAARGICVTYETVRQWAIKFGGAFSDQIRQWAPARGDKWHLDEVVISIAGEPYWLWRAVDQNGFVLDVLVQRRRDSSAARRLLTKRLKTAAAPPRVMITDKLRSYGAALAKMGLRVEHRQHKGLNNRAGELASADTATRTDHEALQISPATQRFLTIHDQVANLFHVPIHKRRPLSIFALRGSALSRFGATSPKLLPCSEKSKTPNRRASHAPLLAQVDDTLLACLFGCFVWD
jgi:putative transposase